jgi:hypothetical protein
MSDPYAYLGETVEACAAKLRGFDLVYRICTDGIEVRVTQDDLSNSLTVTWAELARDRTALPVKTGICAAEIRNMREGRDARRRELQL